MAVTVNSTPGSLNSSNDPYLASLIGDYLLAPVTGSEIEIGYSFVYGFNPYSGFYASPWPNFGMQAMLNAFSSYEKFLNISFTEVPIASSDLLLWWGDNSYGSSVMGWAYDPLAQVASNVGYYQHLYINSQHPLNAENYSLPGGYGFVTYIHELGHILGLEHPHNSSQPFPGVNVSSDLGNNNQNQGIFTTMTYNSGFVTSGYISESHAYGYEGTPMAMDILALQNMYGARQVYNDGDDVYVLPTQNQTGTYWECIYDTGGTDTISAYGAETAAIIDLRSFTQTYSLNDYKASNILGVNGGFTIAKDVNIENAIGSTFDDIIIGNAQPNHVWVSGGSDTIYTYEGDDYVYCSDLNFNTIDAGDGDDTIILYSDSIDFSFNLTNASVENCISRQIDAQDVYSWRQIDKYYNQDWTLTLEKTYLDTSKIQSTRYDVSNSENWTSVTELASIHEVLEWQRILYDDGTSSYTELDFENAEVWSSVVNGNDINGLWDWQLIYNDNQTSSYTDLDQLNEYVWSSVVNGNDINGLWDWQLIYNDNQTSSYTDLDQLNEYVWSSVVNGNDINGLWDWQLIYNDDLTRIYTDLDQNDEYSWDSHVFVMDETGIVVSEYYT